jgi:TonB family protein
MTLAVQNFAVYCLQVAILVAIGGVLPFACRLDNVRARLAWWQILLATCLALPLIQPWKHFVIYTSTALAPFTTAAAAPLPHTPAPFPWEKVLLAIVGLGIAARLLWLAIGIYRLRTYLDGATIYSCPLVRRMEVHAYVGLSDDVTSPVTFGVRRPVILFPARFAEMDPAMQETIACHELLHVHRMDWLFTVGEEVVRALFWFHPAVWWLLGEIQLTREQVVDREVVRLTQSREPYLNALLAIASTRANLDLAPAPLFLRKRHLSQRVSQILKEVNMSRTRIAASLAGFSLLLLLAGMFLVRTLPLEAAPQVKDAPGVSVEHAEANLLHREPVDYPQEARAKGIQGTVTLEVDIDESGAVTDARVLNGPQELRKAALQSVLQWHYAKNMPLPAKAQVSVRFDLPAGAVPVPVRKQPVIVPPPAQASPTVGILKIVDLSSLPEELRAELQQKLAAYQGQPFNNQLMRQIEREAKGIDKHLAFKWSTTPEMENGQRAYTLRLSLDTGFGVGGGVATPVLSAAPPVPDSSGNPPQRIRVGGNVQQMMLIEQPRPVYPMEAKKARIQGVVRLDAVIAKDGTMLNLSVDSGHPLLVSAALDAVKHWVYKPTLLNGEPVEVVTKIDVNFTLSR